MTIEQLVNKWFEVWERGDFENIPVSKNFSHTSPYGTINGKSTYLNLIKDNKDQFLGHTFVIHDMISEDNKACVHYSAIKEDFKLNVSEWHYSKNNLIEKIIAHYHIGNIREDKQLNNL
ncbi:nuclear transport factor 2 family protein [Tamlana sp. 2201CG12-4]|uniref:nuclear transport factor 2 family protein n=1 Tax=Tamlana sp. 2201CG12-4 TaxID=3112582 RepID=UPI002DB9C3BB|nr:nuclear transport factor 2 family protein [Tamlana sp. 2201CG12-4]MEC3905839.1 nuclear transport factor 2 family protein [Tamlana sp. 2201CG12-4]